MYVDFAELKQRVSIEQIIDYLGLKLKRTGETCRGPCPLCDSDSERSFVITPSKNLWYAFCCEQGGDQLELWAKVKGVTQKEAAQAISQHFLQDRPSEAPTAFKGLDYLQADHPRVAALGIPADVAASIGIGFASKGIMRGRVAFPLRSKDGTLIAYCGFNPTLDPPLKVPKF